MSITFLYYEDCPSYEEAHHRLSAVIREEGYDADMEVIKVETEAQAKDLHFIGSPTILINGQDIVRPPDGARYRLACRAYELEDGRISPLPSKAMIRSALQVAYGVSTSDQGKIRNEGDEQVDDP